MNIKQKLTDLWGATQTDYEEELDKSVNDTLELFKQWALEMVAPDTHGLLRFSDESKAEGYNEAKQEIRDRINNVQ